MIRYYAGVVPMKILRRPWPHPEITTKYNALQRGAYASMPIAGALALASGWAMHKPVQFWWLERMFGSYDGARIVHFIVMIYFILFLDPARRARARRRLGHDALDDRGLVETSRRQRMSDEMPQRFVDEKKLRRQSRRDFLLFGAGTFAALAGLWWISPLASKKRIFGEHATDFLDTAAARFGSPKSAASGFRIAP